jgi:hypothetical protein
MSNRWFGIHDGLATAGRIPPMTRIGERISASELALLTMCGATAAAASGILHRGWQIPGSSIILALIPMAFGLALAPRRHAGFIMGTGAISAAVIFNQIGLARIGSGALISLCLIGPVMDFTVNKARQGWRLYSGLILAGVITSMFALGCRGICKLLGFDFLGAQPIGIWWVKAIVTYPLSGAVAGLIAAICFFHLRKQRSESEDAGTNK